MTINEVSDKSEEFKCHMNSEVGKGLGGRQGWAQEKAEKGLRWRSGPTESPRPRACGMRVNTL